MKHISKFLKYFLLFVIAVLIFTRLSAGRAISKYGKVNRAAAGTILNTRAGEDLYAKFTAERSKCDICNGIVRKKGRFNFDNDKYKYKCDEK